ncbi:MAG: hypothetical protein ABR928_22720, partial [Terracidiphilus sp.]
NSYIDPCKKVVNEASAITKPMAIEVCRADSERWVKHLATRGNADYRSGKCPSSPRVNDEIDRREKLEIRTVRPPELTVFQSNRLQRNRIARGSFEFALPSLVDGTDDKKLPTAFFDALFNRSVASQRLASLEWTYGREAKSSRWR